MFGGTECFTTEEPTCRAQLEFVRTCSSQEGVRVDHHLHCVFVIVLVVCSLRVVSSMPSLLPDSLGPGER